MKQTLRSITVSLLLFFLFSTVSFANSRENSNEGLMIFQFTWNAYTYKNDVKVKVIYQKNTTFNKIRSATDNLEGKKNQILVAPLKEGEYTIESIELTGGDIPLNKKLTIPVNKVITIKAGEVINSGLLFLTTEKNKKTNVSLLPIDNTPDIKRHVELSYPDFSEGAKTIKSIIPYLEKERIDKMVQNYADILVNAENSNPRPQLQYMYATLGILLKLERDHTGRVVDYHMFPTNTYQEITRFSSRGEKVLCELGTGYFIYGDTEKMEFVPAMKSQGGPLPVYLINQKQFLSVDNRFNIYLADESFSWRKTNSPTLDKPLMFLPEVYYGPKNLYIYSNGFGKNQKKIVKSAYGHIDFQEVELMEDVKSIRGLTETENKLLIGPKTRGLVKRPALVYEKNVNTGQWQVIELPRGDCNIFVVSKDNEEHFYTQCSWDKILYQSKDGGKNWEKIQKN